MSSIFGIVNMSGEKVDPKIVGDAMGILNHWHPDTTDIIISDGIAFGCAVLHTTHESFHEKLPYHCIDSDCYITADARIDYREELIAKLESSELFDSSVPDSRLILESYKKWGNKCTEFLFGDFAFAIWNNKKKEMFCARDHFGCRPFYYYSHPDFFVFSTEMSAILSMEGVILQIDESWIIEHSVSVISESKRTPFKDLFRLEPAHYCILDSHGIKSLLYWELVKHNEYEDIEEQQAFSRLRELIFDSVNQRVRSAFPVGVELSGGLDSSGIAAVASEICQKHSIPLSAYSQALSERHINKQFPFQDETYFSKKLVLHAKIKDHYLITGDKEGAYAAIHRCLLLLSGPVYQSYAMMSDQLYSAAQNHGTRILLSGLGGDEGVSYRGNGYFEELSQKREWKTLLKEVNMTYEKNSLLKYFLLLKLFALSYVPKLIFFIRLFSPARFHKARKYKLYPIRQRWRKEYRLRNKYLKNITDYSLHSLQSSQHKKIHNITNQNRFENSFLLSQAHKIEYRYPFWDVKLIEYFYNLPSKFKYYQGHSRYAYRKAMEEVLPSEIAWRKNKTGATVPNAFPRLVKDVDKFYELINESQKYCDTHYFDYEKLRILVDNLVRISKGQKANFGPGMVMYSIGILLLQKWQREGKIDIGIKC